MLIPEQRWEAIEGQLNEGQEHAVWVDQKSGAPHWPESPLPERTHSPEIGHWGLRISKENSESSP